MVPVGHNEQQEYQDMQRDFTCCVGSGMESHAMHGLGVWYESDDTIWANLFVPSTAQCTLGKAQLTMETGFPDGDTATIRVALPSPKAFTLAVRRPIWAGDGFAIAVNGEALPQPPLASLNDPVAGGRAGGIGNESEQASSTYVRIARTWKTGDTVTLVVAEVAAPRAHAGQSHGDGHHVGAAGAGRRHGAAHRADAGECADHAAHGRADAGEHVATAGRVRAAGRRSRATSG